MKALWTWTWVAVLAFCLFPGTVQARERGHERGDRGERRSSERRSDRGERDRASQRRSGREHRSDRHYRSGRDDTRQGSGRLSSQGRFSSRAGRTVGREDRGWQGSYRSAAPRRVLPSFRWRPRYPSYYPYGYFYLHGYYFPRYYYDYDRYPTHASIRILVEPSETEVYVDGYYAGVADDFDGIFQRLHLTPGGHEITLRLEGFVTWRAEVYAVPGSTLKLHHLMIPGPGGPDFVDGPGPYEDPGPYE
jgi:hypothetical protein